FAVGRHVHYRAGARSPRYRNSLRTGCRLMTVISPPHRRADAPCVTASLRQTVLGRAYRTDEASRTSVPRGGTMCVPALPTGFSRPQRCPSRSRNAVQDGFRGLLDAEADTPPTCEPELLAQHAKHGTVVGMHVRPVGAVVYEDEAIAN